MVDPEREPLAGLVEVDETSLPFRGEGEPARPGGRTRQAALAGAVEIRGKGPGRIRLAVIGDYSAVALGAFVAAVIAAGSTVVSDGWSGYARLKDVKHDPRVVGDAPAHPVLPWVHRVFANAKRWALGVYHGLREKHLQAYQLDEFVFRFNRRRTPQAAFSRLLGLALTTGHLPTMPVAGLNGISHSRFPSITHRFRECQFSKSAAAGASETASAGMPGIRPARVADVVASRPPFCDRLSRQRNRLPRLTESGCRTN